MGFRKDDEVYMIQELRKLIPTAHPPQITKAVSRCWGRFAVELEAGVQIL